MNTKIVVVLMDTVRFVVNLNAKKVTGGASLSTAGACACAPALVEVNALKHFVPNCPA